MDTSLLFEGMVKRGVEWSKMAEELQETKLSLKVLKLKHDKLSDGLQKLSENTASYDENGLAYRPFKVTGKVDYTKIPELHNLDLEPYRKEDGVMWKLDLLK